MASKKTVVILGGGIGGIVAANDLRRKLPAEHRIVLVERNAEHAFAPSFLWLMTGDRKPEDIRRPLAKLLQQGVEFVHGSVQGLDLARQQIATTAGDIGYDYLIVALGAELAPEAVPGLKEGAETFYTFEGTLRLRDVLARFSGGRVAVVVAAMPYKCPGAPHEGAMLIANYLRKRGLSAKSELHLFTPEPQPMPVAGPQLGDAVKQMLQSKGIGFHPLRALSAVDTQSRTLRFQQGEDFAYDLLVAIPPHRPPAVLRDTGLANPAGWVPVNAHTLATPSERVYAIGDATAVSIPGRWKPDVPMMLPKAGVFAHAQAEVVAARLAAEISGGQPQTEFCGDGYCMLEAGEDLAGIAYGNFFAEPAPQVNLRQIGRAWHIGKVLFEKWWLAPPGWKREFYATLLKTGGKAYGIPVAI
jgi:sulfide:quinone oxidoreductase